MKKISITIVLLAVVSILLLFFFMSREISRLKDIIESTDTTTTIVTITDTVTIEKEIVSPKPKKTIDSSYYYKQLYLSLKDSSYSIEDTLNDPCYAILGDYYTVKQYSEIIKDDSAAKLTFTGKVYQNKLTSMGITGEVYQKIIIKEHIRYPPKEEINRKIICGASYTLALDSLYIPRSSSVSFGIGLRDLKQKDYMLYYDPFNRKITTSIIIPINLRKRK